MDDDRYIRIAVEPMDGLPELLARVRSHGGRPVFLTIPAASPLFLTASEFRALRETVRSANTNLVVISEDRQRQDYAKLFNLVGVENEEAALLWIGEQATPRPTAKPAIDPALGPPRSNGTSGWAPRRDPAPPISSPPQPAPSQPAVDVPVTTTTAIVPVVEPTPLPEPAEQRTRRKWPWLAALLLLLALLAGVVAALPQATVTLTRERTPLTTDLVVAVTEPGVDAPGSDAVVTVAGQRQTTNVTVTATLPATGEQSVPDQPATGSLVFANTGSSPVTLPAGTQIVSDGGVAFTLDAEVTVPAAAGNASGNAEGQITAVEGGSAGNLRQGALSGRHESGLFFSNRNGALTGGTDRTITVISEADLLAASDLLESLLPAAMGEALTESTGGSVAVVPGSVTHPEFVITPAVEVGSEATEFTVSTSTDATGLAFDPDSVREELLPAAIAAVTVPEGQVIDTRDAEITWSAGGSANSATATVLVWQVVALDDATVNGLADELARGTVDEARVRTSSIPGVESVSIEIKPDWLPSAVRERMPLIPQRIEVREE